MPPVTKTKLISIQILNQVIFVPPTKPSKLWSLPWNQVNSDPPHWHHVYFDISHDNQVIFYANTWTMSFSGLVILRVIHTPVRVLVIQPQDVQYNYECQLVFFLTFPYSTVKPRNIAEVYTTFYFRYKIYARLRVILMAGLRHVPFLPRYVRSTSWCHT